MHYILVIKKEHKNHHLKKQHWLNWTHINTIFFVICFVFLQLYCQYTAMTCSPQNAFTTLWFSWACWTTKTLFRVLNNSVQTEWQQNCNITLNATLHISCLRKADIIDQIIPFYITFEGRCVRTASIHSISEAFHKVEMVRMPLIWHDVTTHSFQTLIQCPPLLIMHCTVQQNLVDKES